MISFKLINALYAVLIMTPLYVYTSKETHFTVVIPSYNNARWYQINLDSVLEQAYDNYKVIYINDVSIDETGELVRDYIAHHPKGHKVTLVDNEKRCGALCNIYNAVHSCGDASVIVLVDGDDWLEHNHVLSRLNEVYADGSTWITYGQYRRSHTSFAHQCEEVPAHILQTGQLRSYPWVTSHLRTFYAGLFKKIAVEDLKKDGSFFDMAWDVAILCPMLEMAQDRHSKFISEILYVYNTNNPISDHNVNRDLQLALDVFIRSKQIYKPLDSLFTNHSSYQNELHTASHYHEDQV